MEPILNFQLRPRARFFIVLLSLIFTAELTACSTSDTLDIAAPQAEPSKYAAIVVDAKDGKILYEVAADQIRYPASLAKMMTLYLTFEALENGRLSRTTMIPLSATAARQPATKLYMKAGDTIDVDTAIRALIVKSANDVATALAENLAGSEKAFARQMTAKGRSLGMTRTVFTNASGLPDPKMTTTARDMAVLGMALRRDFPQYYSYFALRSFQFRGKTVRGHNKLLGMVAGADGIKTGYIKASGYNLAASVNRNGRSLVAVVMGGKTGKARDAHMAQLLTATFNRSRRK
ncbi:D-alanyl-D-alanine carboxypeptidase family protein [Oricola nitratireducens]|jgi:D-alanyl-D-alanine carboxypeptidase|uniref:D-alanyl-D-alanine carboxypeptidase family protein n=1 Tax=Oricola nitratireducens TaxID=2775868 RepID=UPI001867DD87|nr:D-alanyl-D-alanine carboxypeptidase family protein [Oricola nitratireducens]